VGHRTPKASIILIFKRYNLCKQHDRHLLSLVNDSQPITIKDYVMKPVTNTLLAAATATSAMTLFSYIASHKEDENFSEPKLLATFLERSLNIEKEAAPPLGWLSHYLIGAGFGVGYKLFLKLGKTQASPLNGLLYGAAAGASGILWWKTMFENHPNPPKTHRKGYYTQLMIAHLIFGVTLSAFKDKRIV
jgi:hypothetical protein